MAFRSVEAIIALVNSTNSENELDSSAWQIESGVDVADEVERSKLIGEIMQLIREPGTPERTRSAGLTLVGWLARRKPEEHPHTLGVVEARESERRMRAFSQKNISYSSETRVVVRGLAYSERSSDDDAPESSNEHAVRAGITK